MLKLTMKNTLQNSANINWQERVSGQYSLKVPERYLFNVSLIMKIESFEGKDKNYLYTNKKSRFIYKDNFIFFVRFCLRRSIVQRIVTNIFGHRDTPCFSGVQSRYFVHYILDHQSQNNLCF